MLFNTFRFRLGIVPENGTTFMQMLQKTVMTEFVLKFIWILPL